MMKRKKSIKHRKKLECLKAMPMDEGKLTKVTKLYCYREYRKKSLLLAQAAQSRKGQCRLIV